ncbi:MAG: DUF357 domain-containing protein [Candidatus Diapherotrites archaeon]|uniref:DUF357 domain-containing protein n=1 Tax=Candidatus Iainarchaeum sp. TaxID=3101447 RepID=A0A8T4C6E5_9ARCH|nr:DUF357 domain-containing protein [Candidatus Diapherotrites archaeon]
MVKKTKTNAKQMPTRSTELNNQLVARVTRYHTITKQALEKIGMKARRGTREYDIAMDFLSMAKNYFNDAAHFEKNGELLLALAAYSYAHAWMDAGVRAGILDGKEDDRLFTLP